MLSDAEARIMEQWTKRATAWAEASQTFVSASTELVASTRRLADDLAADLPEGSPRLNADERTELSQSLFALAGVVEDGARSQSEGYLGTAASLEQLRSLHG